MMYDDLPFCQTKG